MPTPKELALQYRQILVPGLVSTHDKPAVLLISVDSEMVPSTKECGGVYKTNFGLSLVNVNQIITWDRGRSAVLQKGYSAAINSIKRVPLTLLISGHGGLHSFVGTSPEGEDKAVFDLCVELLPKLSGKGAVLRTIILEGCYTGSELAAPPPPAAGFTNLCPARRLSAFLVALGQTDGHAGAAAIPAQDPLDVWLRASGVAPTATAPDVAVLRGLSPDLLASLQQVRVVGINSKSRGVNISVERAVNGSDTKTCSHAENVRVFVAGEGVALDVVAPAPPLAARLPVFIRFNFVRAQPQGYAAAYQRLDTGDGPLLETVYTD